MFPKQCVRWLATLAVAAATLLTDAGVARGDVWSSSSGCDCGHQFPTAGCAPEQSNSCLSRPYWARPTPAYNSSWQRVPVTNYRPQVVNDPLTGARFSELQPCNTQEWQLRRTTGCSLWQCFVDWWRSHCCCIGSQRMSPTTMPCTPTSERIVTSPEPTASPYYAPSSNGRLVPTPSGVSPMSPVPADGRPQLDPLPQRPVGEGSASRLLPPDTEVPDTEVFVGTFDHSNASLELGPPLVAPLSQAAETGSADDQATSSDETSLELIPVGLSIATPSDERKLPTDKVWDDTGWQSEQ